MGKDESLLIVFLQIHITLITAKLPNYISRFFINIINSPQSLEPNVMKFPYLEYYIMHQFKINPTYIMSRRFIFLMNKGEIIE